MTLIIRRLADYHHISSISQDLHSQNRVLNKEDNTQYSYMDSLEEEIEKFLAVWLKELEEPDCAVRTPQVLQNRQIGRYSAATDLNSNENNVSDDYSKMHILSQFGETQHSKGCEGVGLMNKWCVKPIQQPERLNLGATKKIVEDTPRKRLKPGKEPKLKKTQPMREKNQWVNPLDETLDKEVQHIAYTRKHKSQVGSNHQKIRKASLEWLDHNPRMTSKRYRGYRNRKANVIDVTDMDSYMADMDSYMAMADEEIC